MIKNSLTTTTTAVVISAALLAAGSGVRQRAEAAPRRAASIGKANFSPKRLPGIGGPVNLRLRITTPRGSLITSATARALLKGATRSGASATLQGSGNGLFTGVVSVPANTAAVRTTADIYVDVVTTTGEVTKRVARVSIDAFNGDPNLPPGPPPI